MELKRGFVLPLLILTSVVIKDVSATGTFALELQNYLGDFRDFSYDCCDEAPIDCGGCDIGFTICLDNFPSSGPCDYMDVYTGLVGEDMSAINFSSLVGNTTNPILSPSTHGR
ncbi:uncharacterized protein LOC115919315 [Strongylocentrotus purpuratus]|uniref:Notch ligand N-terminal domain-containing protein n=1 Tax=Strongylocentrotus purpuratus TaxID=7668 RepID=A0A7M7MZ52_STRPU|nr:uncharacterized protein LOC115919315 [Strongylocentrotus purpuratus]